MSALINGTSLELNLPSVNTHIMLKLYGGKVDRNFNSVVNYRLCMMFDLFFFQWKWHFKFCGF